MAKLTQLVLMLSSEHDGEIVAAAKAIGRSLQADGKDWHWLGDLIEGRLPPPAQDKNPLHDILWQEGVEAVLAVYGNHLSDREEEFLVNMSSWYGEPTAKQRKWLVDIFARFNVMVMW